MNEVILNGIPMTFMRRYNKVLLYRSRYGWCESFTDQQFRDALSPDRRGQGGGGNHGRGVKIVVNRSGVRW